MGKKTTTSEAGAKEGITPRSRTSTTTNGNGNGHAPKTARRAASSASGPTAVASKAPAKAAAKTSSRASAPAKASAEPSAKPTAKSSAKPRATSARNGSNGHSIRIDTEQIAIRAYFIAERRQNEGRSGDPTEDWIIAEQELIAEIRRS